MMSKMEIIDITKVSGHTDENFDTRNSNEAMEFRSEKDKSLKFSLSKDKQEYLDSIKEELEIRCNGLKMQIFEIGKLLFEAKEILPHGQFKPWINNNFEFCYETALNYMRVYTACMGHPEMVEYFKPASLYVIANPKFPKRLRQDLFEGVKGPVDITKKDLVQLALRFKKGELNISDKEVQDLLIRQRDISRWEEYKTELKSLNKVISKRLKRIVELANNQKVNPLINIDTEDNEQFREDEQHKIIEQVKEFMDEIDNMINELDKKCN